LSGLGTYCFEFSVVLVFQTLLGHPPHWTIVLTIPLIFVVATLAFGCGLFLSAANVYFRDLQHFINVMLQLLFWGAPIIYDISFVQGKHPGAVTLLRINPLTDLLVAFREVLLLGKVPGLLGVAYATGLAVLSVVLGWIYFNRHERRMAELV